MRKDKMKISVLSDGAWGTSLATVLCKNGHEVKLWGPFPDYIARMDERRENFKFLSGISLPEGLELHDDMEKAVSSAELLVLAAPSQYMRQTLEKLKPFFSEKQIILNVAKGIENKTLKHMSDLCYEILGDCRYSVLSGPSHAEEVAKKCPTAVVAASESSDTSDIVQKAFMNEYFRVYTTEDVVSVELGGALKNVFAIAAGVIDGMGIGDNPKAALITRGIAEMSRLGAALGGRQETFAGLSGTGDLIVTCMSKFSRNRHVGQQLGMGKKLPAILKEMGMVVAEGVKNSESAYQLAKKHSVDTPIINEVYSVLYKAKSPSMAVKDLMTRKARTEFD